MTVDQFRILNESDKLSAILQYGTLMAQNADSNCRIFLYRMEAFFVTATYSIEDDRLTEITCYLDVVQKVPHYRKKLISFNAEERAFQTPQA